MPENTAGQDAPVIDEATQTAATPEKVETTDATTQGAEGEVKETAVEKTYSKAEMQEIVERATAKAAAKAERKAFQEALETVTRNKAPEAQQTDDELPPRRESESDAAYIRRIVQTEVQKGSEQQSQQTRAQKAESIYAEAMKETGLEREDMEITARQMTPAMSQTLVDSSPDMAGKLLAYLSTNSEEIDRIKGLTPARQAAEMGKLEMKLSAPKVKTSSAPAPIDPLGSGKTQMKSLANATQAEYEAMRAKQGARWARR